MTDVEKIAELEKKIEDLEMKTNPVFNGRPLKPVSKKEYDKQMIENICDVTDVVHGYFYWIGRFLNMAIDIFKWDGLPGDVPEEEIEKNLIFTGHAGLFTHPKYGPIVCHSYIYGQDIYQHFKYADFTNASEDFKMNGTKMHREIGKDCVMVYADEFESYYDINVLSMNTFFNTIRRYARMMTDIESSLNFSLIQTRQPFVPVAPDTQTKNSFNEVFKKIKMGQMDIPVDSSFMKDIQILKNTDQASAIVQTLTDLRTEILKNFYAELGIYFSQEDKERYLQEELNMKHKNMKLFIYSQLRSRQKGAEKISKFFGTETTVSLRTEIFDESTLYDSLYDDIQALTSGGEENEIS